MPAYVIANVDVHDMELYREYAQLVPATLAPYGGRFLVRGGNLEALEGDWLPPRLVVIEFPSADQARQWYESEAYAAAIPLRQRASDGTLLLVEGLE